MAKVKITGFFKSSEYYQEYDTMAIYDEQTLLKFRSEKDDNSIMIINLKDKQLVRENNDIKLVLTFSESIITIMSCEFKSFNKKIDLKVKTLRLISDSESFFVEYETYDDTEKIDTFVLSLKFNLEK